MLGLLAQIRAGAVELVSSTVLELETQRNPLAIRREHGEQVLAEATSIVTIDKSIEQRALHFVQVRITILDALHLAAAEAGGADYFCTCDDRFLRRAKTLADVQTKVVSPIELIEELEQ